MRATVLVRNRTGRKSLTSIDQWKFYRTPNFIFNSTIAWSQVQDEKEGGLCVWLATHSVKNLGNNFKKSKSWEIRDRNAAYNEHRWKSKVSFCSNTVIGGAQARSDSGNAACMNERIAQTGRGEMDWLRKSGAFLMRNNTLLWVNWCSTPRYALLSSWIMKKNMIEWEPINSRIIRAEHYPKSL